ncbi:MAG: imidazole glycerol phosphate synthase subunit HisH [Lachnospiraceae bacterium]|nr:imidazole glycerol phosphate synthase subunit HisH [Lachnospiraceae bacterium]
MIAIIDYDAGNIRSVEKACRYLGKEPVTTREPEVIRKADHVILPGVGAFGDCMEHLKKYDLIDVIREITSLQTPFLGICLGLQLLYPASEESPGAEGLSILDGTITRIPDHPGLKVPNIGWNSCRLINDGRLFQGIPDEPFFYFVHSYFLTAKARGTVRAVIDYGGTQIDASVESGNTFACQFHPEKSGETGLAVLQNFLRI